MSVKALFVSWCPKDALDGMMQLDPMEELAYRRILDLIYVTGNRLADDDKKLAWMTKTGRRWKAIKASLLAGEDAKLFIRDGFICNRKCDVTLQQIDSKIERKRAAGKASAKARKYIKNNKTDRTPVDAALKKSEPEPSTQRQRIQESGNPVLKEEANASCKSAKRGCRLPEDWTLPTPWKDEARAMGHPDPDYEAGKFRDYWIGRAGAGAVKLDWRATWRNWVRKAVEDSARTRGGKNQAAANGFAQLIVEGRV